MTRVAPAKRCAFTLIEMLCVMFLIVVVTGMMALMLRESLGLHRAQTEMFDRVVQQSALADRFRTDVAEAESAPGTWGDYQADSKHLILLLPNGNHLVYAWEEGKLTRHSFAKAAGSAALLPTEDSTVEFIQEPGAKLLRLRIVHLATNQAASGEALEIAAALGGDWR